MKPWFMVGGLFLVGCSGPYGDLERSFAVDRAASSATIAVDRIVFTSQRHAGAHSFKRALDIRLLSSELELQPTFPFSVGLKPVRISASAVDGCSRTCFGDGVWDANVLIASTGTEISIPSSRAVIDWCWNNKIPMISGNDRRQWMYRGVSLPPKDRFVDQLASRERYEHDGKQSCLGY